MTQHVMLTYFKKIFKSNSFLIWSILLDLCQYFDHFNLFICHWFHNMYNPMCLNIILKIKQWTTKFFFLFILLECVNPIKYKIKFFYQFFIKKLRWLNMVHWTNQYNSTAFFISFSTNLSNIIDQLWLLLKKNIKWIDYQINSFKFVWHQFQQCIYVSSMFIQISKHVDFEK